MKILHINLSPPGEGGIERILIDFLSHSRVSGNHVAVCVLGGSSEVCEELRRQGHTIWTLNKRVGGFDFRLYSRVYKLLRSFRPDVVHIHGTPGVIYGILPAIAARSPAIVYTCHFSRSTHSPLKHLLLSALLRLATIRIGVSKAAQAALVRYYYVDPKSIRLICNGVDVREFRPRPKSGGGNVTIGFCGVFRPEKQVPLLITAFSKLLQTGVDAKLVLVGNGPTMEACCETVRGEGLGESDVHFAGLQSDVRDHLSQMDVFVLPSTEEAMPVALLEAMAMGKAVVASSVGGISEVVTDGVTGLLLDPTTVESLTHALVRLCADVALREQLGEAARKHVADHFSLDAMMRQYTQLYREIVTSDVDAPNP